MLRALARARGATAGLPAALQAPAAPAATQLPTLRFWRPHSTGDASEGSTGDGGEPDAPAAPSGRTESSPARPNTKEWRSWIDTKLDSTLGGVEEAPAAAAPAAAAAAAAVASSSGDVEERARRAVAIANALEAADALPGGDAPAPRPKGPAPAAQPRARGYALEQEIYRIVTPAARPAEDASLPEGVANYGQLAMAGDAPRFERSSLNIANLSPQRIHPTRLFFPDMIYAPVELDPYKGSETAHDFNQPRRAPLTPDEVTRLADYKNAPLLASFLSETGKLPPRSRTGLRAKLHRHLARQVKIARQMGILSHTERWQPADTAPRSAFQWKQHAAAQQRKKQT